MVYSLKNNALNIEPNIELMRSLGHDSTVNRIKLLNQSNYSNNQTVDSVVQGTIGLTVPFGSIFKTLLTTSRQNQK